MGVPGFVAWLRKYFNDEMILKKVNDIHTLYIDGNCVIHPKCFEVLANVSVNETSKIETIMFKRICKFIDFLIDYTKPEVCFFAVDGVAPAAKINQQRFRRYKAMHDKELDTQLRKKYNIEQGHVWSNTVITPGTEFMDRLHMHLKKHFKNHKTKCIYSSYKNVGEGEHKIMDNIRNQESTKNDVIYGLDADLFFLALSCNRNNLFLLREEHNFIDKTMKHKITDIINDVSENMRYVCIDTVKKCYDIKLSNEIKKSSMHNFYKDFIFLCYLLGNDFLPHLPSLEIRHEGIELILHAYVSTFNIMNVPLIDNHVINTQFLIEILRIISTNEKYYFEVEMPKQKMQQHYKRCPQHLITDGYKRETWERENIIKAHDPINLGYGSENSWKSRYYYHYYHTHDINSNAVKIACDEYMRGLMWTYKYYHFGCPDWTWKYPYINAPFVSDIYKYMNTQNIDLNDYTFTIHKPLTATQQLFAVLPYACVDIVPEKYKKLMTDKKSPIIDLYPKHVEMDMINKTMYWTCIPKLPYLDLDRIIAIIL